MNGEKTRVPEGGGEGPRAAEATRREKEKTPGRRGAAKVKRLVNTRGGVLLGFCQAKDQGGGPHGRFGCCVVKG